MEDYTSKILKETQLMNQENGINGLENVRLQKSEGR